MFVFYLLIFVRKSVIIFFTKFRYFFLLLICFKKILLTKCFLRMVVLIFTDQMYCFEPKSERANTKMCLSYLPGLSFAVLLILIFFRTSWLLILFQKRKYFKNYATGSFGHYCIVQKFAILSS